MCIVAAKAGGQIEAIFFKRNKRRINWGNESRPRLQKCKNVKIEFNINWIEQPPRAGSTAAFVMIEVFF